MSKVGGGGFSPLAGREGGGEEVGAGEMSKGGGVRGKKHLSHLLKGRVG